MLKQTITYEDWDENTVTEDLYFNITRIELAENLDLRDELQEVEKQFKGATRDLTPAEIKQILNVVKRLMRIAYGVRDYQTGEFVKNDQVWTSFTQRPVYDAFLMNLFENPEKANDFMVGLVPKQMREQVAKLKTEDTPDLSVVQEPAHEKTFKDYTKQQLLEMPWDQFNDLVGTDPSKMTNEQLQVAFQRKTQ